MDDDTPRLKSGAKAGRPKGRKNNATIAREEAYTLAAEAADKLGLTLHLQTPLQSMQFARAFFEDQFMKTGEIGHLMKVVEIASKEAPYSHARKSAVSVETTDNSKEEEAQVSAMSPEELRARFGPKDDTSKLN